MLQAEELSELLEAVADVLSDYAHEVGHTPSITRLFNADHVYNGDRTHDD